MDTLLKEAWGGEMGGGGGGEWRVCTVEEIL